MTTSSSEMRIDEKMADYKDRPSPKTAKERKGLEKLEKEIEFLNGDLEHAVRDGEVLIEGYVPANYIQLPPPPSASTKPPININPLLIAPSASSNTGEKK